MKIKDVKMTRNQHKEVIKTIASNLNNNELQDWINFIAENSTLDVKRKMLSFWEDSQELEYSLLYNEVIEE